MKLYARVSLFRWRWIRRLRYGRGRGIHSPKAFALVNTLCRPHGEYYPFEECPTLFEAPLARLVFRMVARCRIETVVTSPHSPFCAVAKMANSGVRLQQEWTPTDPSPTFFIIDDVESQLAPLSLQADMMLLIPLEKGREVVKRWIAAQESGLVLDLYEAMLIVGMPNVKYLYRSSL